MQEEAGEVKTTKTYVTNNETCHVIPSECYTGVEEPG
jgi:hypothetical protein